MAHSTLDEAVISIVSRVMRDDGHIGALSSFKVRPVTSGYSVTFKSTVGTYRASYRARVDYGSSKVKCVLTSAPQKLI